MTRAQLSKVWFAISALLLYYSLNSWIVAQGGNEIFGAKLIVSNKVPAVMVAIPVCAILLFVSSLVGRVLALRGGQRWHERIPVVGFDKIETGSREGRVYQGTMLVLFSFVPILAITYFWSVFTAAKVMRNDGSKTLLHSVWDWTGLYTLNDPARICTDFNTDLRDPCLGNASVLPGLEPIIFAVVTAVAVLSALAHWRAVATGR